VARSVVDSEEAHLVWRWLTGEGVTLEDADGPLDLPTRPVRQLDRIAV
jgi:hypothetical protein